MSSKPIHITFFILITLLIISFEPAAAPATSSKASPVSQKVLESKIKETKVSAELDEESKTKLIELYRKSVSQLKKVRSNGAHTKEYIKAKQEAPHETKKIKQHLEKSLPQPSLKSLKVSETTPLSDLEQILVKEQADLSEVETKLDDVDKQLDEKISRPAIVRGRLTEAKHTKDQIAEELKLPPSANESHYFTQARQWFLQTQQKALSSEIKMLDQELLSQAPRLDLLRAQRDKEMRSVSFIRSRVALLEELVNRLRLAEAELIREEAEAVEIEAVGKHQLIQDVAQQNAALTDELATMAAQWDKISEKKESANEKAKQIENEYRSAKQKLEIAGLSQALGRILLVQRRQLPTSRELHKPAMEREEAIANAGLLQVRLNEERRKIRDIKSAVANLTIELPFDEQEKISEELSGLVKNRLLLLDKAITTNGAYLSILSELEFSQRRLSDVVREYGKFLAEKLLWLRNVSPINISTLIGIPGEFIALLSPQGWLNVINTLVREALHKPVLIPVFIVVGILLWYRRKLNAVLKSTSKWVGKVSSDNFTYTIKALVITLMLAISWPLLLIVISIQLLTSFESSDFSKAVGYAIQAIVPMYAFLRGFSFLCIPDGMAVNHFRWPASTARLIRKQVHIVMLIALPAAFVTVMSSWLTAEIGGVGVSQTAFILLLLALAYFISRILHPKRGVLSSYLLRKDKSWLSRLRYVWYPFSVGVPLALTLLQLVGYLYTAATLTQSLINSLALILTVVILHELVVRWLLLTRSKIAWQAARERYLAAREQQKDTQTGDTGEGKNGSEIPEPEIDLDTIDTNTRKLLNTALVITTLIGLWLIWSSVLPAFRILDDVSLWQHMAIVDGKEKLVPITLGNLAWAVILVIITTASARNFPSVLEIALLQHLSMDTGGRYTVTTLTRYIIVGIGIVLIFQTLGGSWSQIQWLVAALGVGIGFGLQEIVANFVSGLIILFERPIRVGDTVTVGETTGKVTRIRIRATTIRNWDKQELLVPNKEFITGRLLNWSLSDQTNRITIPVGVAYGSDIPKALQLLREAAVENELVIHDPEPIITFEGFGDNSLNLVLRCYLDTLDNRLETISKLHQAINNKFEQAGIVISFPQRDIHIDTSKPLEIYLSQQAKLTT